ncbi:MAG: protein kinase [Candidatus Schekmanbacteria bacterium]|nr:protein kinase [Candidatus Schekmanbacteria bacterium]
METDLREVIAGRFEVRELLERDGLGTCYRAFDRERMAEVRLRRLHPHLALDAVLRRRFLRELAILARLRHPGVLAGYEAFAAGADVGYATELARGPSLASLIARGTVSTASALACIRNLLDVLDHVHGEGVVHRDLAPRHVYLDAEQARVSGFASARVADLATVTLGSQVVGSPLYLAPELFHGAAASAASDLFAAGAILFELVARRPLRAEAAIAAPAVVEPLDVERWCARLGWSDPTVIERSIAVLLAGLLHPEPTRRFQSGAEAIAAVSEESAEIAQGGASPSCPACDEPTIEPDGLCIACGTSVAAIKRWGRGPYAVIMHPSRRPKGRRRRGGRADFSAFDPRRRSVAVALLELLYGPLPPGEARRLRGRLVVARRVDRQTAERLRALLACRGFHAAIRWHGAAGDLALRFVLRMIRAVPRPLAALGLTIGFTVPVLAAIAMSLLLARFALTGIPPRSGPTTFLSLLAGIFLVPTLFFRSLLFTRAVKDDARSGEAFPQSDNPILGLPAKSTVDRYRRIADSDLRGTARRLLGATRAVEAALLVAPDSPPRQAARARLNELLQALSELALEQLAALPAVVSERQAELLLEAQGLEVRLAVAPDSERSDLEQSRVEIDRALDRLNEAAQARVSVVARVERCTLALRRTRATLHQQEHRVLAARLDLLLGELAAPAMGSAPQPHSPTATASSWT